MMNHLHIHSTFSFLEGLASPQELVNEAARLEMPALGLADHGRLTGAIEFIDACFLVGIKPVIGLSLDVAPPVELSVDTTAQQSQLILLAEDLSGWTSLCRLASDAQSNPTNNGLVNYDYLATNTKGLICLTGGRRSLSAYWAQQPRAQSLESWLGYLKELFAGRLYLELQLHTQQDRNWVNQLNLTGKSARLPIVATHAIFYLKQEQSTLQSVVSAIRLNKPVQELSVEEKAPPGAYFVSSDEMAKRFAEFPKALAATIEIADRCRLELPLGKAHFPKLEQEEGISATQVLREKACRGAIRLYSTQTGHSSRNSQVQVNSTSSQETCRLDADIAEIPEAIQKRLEHELSIIEQCGYEPLFLVMEKIVGFARQSGIPIASRGSASSSLVAHCLGITTPDPVRLNLYFERFLNPARATPPDIDTDLCSRRRDEVIDFVYKHFGSNRVAMVCTINRFRRRSALREVAKAHGLPAEQVNALAKALPYRWYGPPERFNQDQEPYADLQERYSSPLHQQVFRDSTALIGIPRHLSIHPGGIVISPGDLMDFAPTQLATKGIHITQFDLESISRIGLVKIDLLGIRGLTVLGDVIQALKGKKRVADAGEEVYILDRIPNDDPLTSATVEHGRTIGCFQIESPGMRATLKEIRAKSVDDIMAALALYRPGPLSGGLRDAFVARYRGSEPADYLHPALEPLLNDTYGVILYQEQVLRIAHELAGLSIADSDLLRRAMSHFDPGKQMQTLRERFIEGAATNCGVPVETAGRIWELMAAFAGYGFPKAHAASYARVAWQAAWCKTNYPDLFMAAVLANWGGYYSQRVYLTEARRMGLKIMPPDVNYAGSEFSVRYPEGEPILFMGLNQVRELTHRTQSAIIRQQPYGSFVDFLAKVDPRPIEAENLVHAGAFQRFGSIPDLLNRLEQGGWHAGQLPLFEIEKHSAEDLSLAEKAAQQEKVLGVSLIAHPLELVADQIASAGAVSTVDAAQKLGEKVRVAGIRQVWRRGKDKRGDYIYFMAFEDLEGMVDVVIHADVYQRFRSAFSSTGPYLIEGEIQFDPEKGEPFIRAERAWKI